ncbi:DUF1822 family protein [Phormidium sp. LEGE 05292]|uniref:DUF1822 family protein n=1 Tax=[Phormidium] sp. LEGE 05292 TaxID=767427 RepID=UPI00187FAC3F|nr:DUF1822 family protein [Phormidium sp. LEGE 05292]MBE9229336.1 DUF1822 family protein [Phormidium sp. LEGE 05292]
MKSNIQTLSNIYSEHLWLELSEEDLKQAKPEFRDYSNQTGCYYAYINRLCLNGFLKWMQENLGEDFSFSRFPNDKIYLNIWEFVNGCGINLNNKRLVLIPSDSIDIADFGVPQEWVDIPNWVADYYLPVGIDLEAKYLHFWGLVSRETLKAQADYDPIYRCYYLSEDYVIPNLEILETVLHFCPDEKGEVTPLAKISANEAECLIKELSKPSPYSPRLQAKFEKWGALLNDNSWLQKLYERRVKPVTSLSAISVLNQWLDDVVEAGWQTFEELFTPRTLAPAFRGKRVRGIELGTPENIQRAVRQLYNSQTEVAFPSNSNEPDALVYLLQNTQDESIRWKAAEYLWTIAPNYPGLPIRRVMDLGVQLMGHPIALMVAVLRKLDGKIAVLLRAYPICNLSEDSQTKDFRDDNVSLTKLPPGLRLMGLYENGNPIPGLEAVARNEPQDDYISLYFTADLGDRFHVRLTLKDVSITEQFVV